MPIESNDPDTVLALVRVYQLILQAAQERKAKIAEANDHPANDEYPGRIMVQETSVNAPCQTMPQDDLTTDPEQNKENDIENSPQSLKL